MGGGEAMSNGGPLCPSLIHGSTAKGQGHLCLQLLRVLKHLSLKPSQILVHAEDLERKQRELLGYHDGSSGSVRPLDPVLL